MAISAKGGPLKNTPQRSWMERVNRMHTRQNLGEALRNRQRHLALVVELHQRHQPSPDHNPSNRITSYEFARTKGRPSAKQRPEDPTKPKPDGRVRPRTTCEALNTDKA
ncbi:hypothetical protein SLA2020_435740 [Shorea laevis]